VTNLIRAAGARFIAETELGSAATTVDLTDIPGTFKDLLLVGRLRTDRSAVNDDVLLQLGSSSGIDSTSGNYNWHQYRLGDSNVESAGFSTQTSITLTSSTAPAGTATAGAWAQLELTIFDYANVTYNRQVQGQISAYQVSANRRISVFHGQWLNTADAVARIRLLPGTGPNFVTGSKIRLYGLT
jgi:hypothetical protein